jgi:hypothetical protein
VAGKTHSLRDRQRENIMHAYRARGHRNNNLWLVYSYKTNRDWILPSDRQLIHWIHHLEINPKVRSFTLTPDPVYGHDGERERITELDAEVIYIDNTVEWHEVKAGDDIKFTSQISAQQSAAERAGRIYKVVTDTDLSPHVKTSVRWLKAIGYAAAIRGREHMPSRLALVSFLKKEHFGTVGAIYEELSGHDPSVVGGLLVRLAIEGHISLDLVHAGFGHSTPWRSLVLED